MLNSEIPTGKTRDKSLNDTFDRQTNEISRVSIIAITDFLLICIFQKINIVLQIFYGKLNVDAVKSLSKTMVELLNVILNGTI